MKNDFTEKMEQWETVRKTTINSIDAQLESKTSELERNLKLVVCQT